MEHKTAGIVEVHDKAQACEAHWSRKLAKQEPITSKSLLLNPLISTGTHSDGQLANGSIATRFMILKFALKQYYHILMSIHKNVAG